MAALAAPASNFGEWLQGVLNQHEVPRSTLYRNYIRMGGERSTKAFHNWCNGVNAPDIDDAARLVKALEMTIPDGNVRASFDRFLRSFKQSPRGSRGHLKAVPDGAPLIAATAKPRSRLTARAQVDT